MTFGSFWFPFPCIMQKNHFLWSSSISQWFWNTLINGNLVKQFKYINFRWELECWSCCCWVTNKWYLIFALFWFGFCKFQIIYHFHWLKNKWSPFASCPFIFLFNEEMGKKKLERKWGKWWKAFIKCFPICAFVLELVTVIPWRIR